MSAPMGAFRLPYAVAAFLTVALQVLTLVVNRVVDVPLRNTNVTVGLTVVRVSIP